jgi:hypothetical protein
MRSAFPAGAYKAQDCLRRFLHGKWSVANRRSKSRKVQRQGMKVAAKHWELRAPHPGAGTQAMYQHYGW